VTRSPSIATFDYSTFHTAAPRPFDPLEDRNWNIRRGDLAFPMLTLNERVMQENIAAMAAYCSQHGVELSPHGKTTMMPWIFKAQLSAGASGITAATPAHCQTYRAFGISQILLANVLVDPAMIRWISSELDRDPGFEFVCYVDSHRGIEIMEEALAGAHSSRPIDVLIELGYQGGRTGSRTIDDAMILADRVAASPKLKLRGVSAFEGFFPIATDPQASQECTEYLQCVHTLVNRLHEAGADAEDPLIVTAGGSALFDLVLEILGPDCFSFATRTVLRSGCYVSHDSGMYEELSPLDGRSREHQEGELNAALALWATVWSRPEPELAIVGFGRRDAPWDNRFPRAERVFSHADSELRELNGRFEITALNDQHAYMRVPADDQLMVGDQVVFGVSHPCGAFDRWPWIAVVDDDDNVLGGARTYF
jgi:D-serine dehydratase